MTNLTYFQKISKQVKQVRYAKKLSYSQKPKKKDSSNRYNALERHDTSECVQRLKRGQDFIVFHFSGRSFFPSFSLKNFTTSVVFTNDCYLSAKLVGQS